MNERMVEILVYILRELRDKPRGIRNLDLLSKDLVRQGYTENEINSAFSWLFDRIQNNFVGVMKHAEAARDQSHRFFREMEKRVITPAAYGYLIQVRELGLIDDLEMEQVLERILMLDRGHVTVDDMKSLVAEMLFGPANQRFRSYFILDDKERRVH